MENRQLNLDRYGNPILTKTDARKALLYGQNISGVVLDDEEEVELFNKNSERVLGVEEEIRNILPDDISDYHELCAQEWDIPQKYKEIDILSELLCRCSNDVERQRIEKEYAMFAERNLLPLLSFLFFIVDYMRDNNIVWGVGRGSSVASFALYLIGLHKVNSIKYDLPIEEFLK